jgi:hypothetical protein
MLERFCHHLPLLGRRSPMQHIRSLAEVHNDITCMLERFCRHVPLSWQVTKAAHKVDH